MSKFLTRNRVFLAKAESTIGVDASPTVGADAIRVTDLNPTQQLDTINPNEFTGSLDRGPDLPAGGFATFNMGAPLRGAGTAGLAPDNGVLYRGAGMSEVLNGSDISGTASAGSASSITLEPADITANGEHVGGIIELTGGTGFNASNPKANRRVITSSVASSGLCGVYPDWDTAPNGTTDYDIKASAIYKPISTGLETLTLYNYDRQTGGGDARIRKSLGSAGTFSINLPVRGPGVASFQYRGNLISPADITDPGDATLTNVSALPWLNAQTYLGGAIVCPNTLTIDYGGTVVAADCPNEVYGYEQASITERAISGTINPPIELVAVRDTFTSWLNSTGVAFWTTYGAAEGTRVSLYMPNIRYGGPSDADNNGFAQENIPFTADAPNAGLYICFW